jgi:DNA-binding SARP family transcriptional activator/tetratricopeptide (TPR) repeat protein
MTAQAGGSFVSERPVKILLLGPPEIYINGKIASIKRRLNRALLFYLAGQPHPVARSEVCEMFWPTEDEEKGRKNLREALSRLRQEMGIPNLIIAAGDYLSLDPSLIDVDLLAYQRIMIPLLSSSEFNSTGTLQDWIVLELKRALTLCRWPQFMQGFSLPEAVDFENWAEFHNQAYIVSRMKALDRIFDHYISSGNLDEAIVWLGIAVQSEPLDEELNFLMLICLRDMGRIEEMIVFVNYLEGVMERSGEPLPARFADLKNQALQSKEYAGRTESLWPVPEPGAPDFVGRETELDILNKALRRRGIVLLEGEAGIGKTRLLKQFFTQQAFPPRLIYCPGHPLTSQTAFHIIAHAMRTQILDSEWYALPEDEIQILDDFYHRLMQDSDGSGLPSFESERLPVMDDVFFAFMHLLEITAAHRPLLFILDDAMWADRGSILLVSFLIEHGFFDRFGLLVISLSPDVANDDLLLLLQRLRRAKKLITIQMTPFTNPEIERFIGKILGRIPSTEDVLLLQKLTGGTPYFLSECIRGAQWITTGDQVRFPEQNFIPPDSIVSLVRDKVSGLEPESVIVLEAAVILGSKFCPDVIEEMIGFSTEEIDTCLEELTNEGFLIVYEEIRPLGGYQFKHEIERLVLLANMPPAKKRDLHLKAAGALKKQRGDFPGFSEALAMHWEIGLHHEEALEAWLDAGRYARSQYSKEKTYRIYGKALDHITKAPGIYNEKTLYEVVNEYGNYAYDRDDMGTCEKIYRTCLEIGELTQNRMLIGTAYNGLGRVAFFNNQFEAAQNYLRQANWFIEKTDMRVERVKSLSLLGSIHYSLDNYQASQDWMEKALALTEDLSEPYIVDARVDILSVLCAVLCYQGKFGKALNLAEEMVNLGFLASRRSVPLQANAILAMCLYFNDRIEECVRVYEESLPLVERFQLRFWHSLLEISASLAYLEMGFLDNAWYLADQAYKRELPYKTEKLSMHAAKALGDFYRSVGNQEKAIEYYKENIQGSAKNFQTTISKYYIGVALVDAGKRNDGQKWVYEAIADASEKGIKGIESTMKLGKLIFDSRKKPSVNDFSDVRNILEQMRMMQNPRERFFENTMRGFLAETSQKWEEAIATYQQSISQENIRGNVWLELLGYQRILKIAPPGSPAQKAGVKRINEIIEILQNHATLPLVKREFQKLRVKLKRYVNAVSTY